MNSNSSSSPPQAVLSLAYAFFSIELITCASVLVIACLNLVVICPTTLLHSNLKAILITQTVAVVLFVQDRLAMLVQKFVFNDPFAPANQVLQSFMTFDSIFKRMLGHALIIERFVATMRPNSYQNFFNYFFGLVWFSVSFAIAFANMITNKKSWLVTQFNLITSIVSAVLSFIELMIIVVIGNYNRQKYINQLKKASANNYNISKRYQILDNVHTAKQLLPTFFCIFLTNVLISLTYFIIMRISALMENYLISIFFAAFIWIDSIISGIIELTIITHHPMLKKRFIRLIKIVFHFKYNHIGDVQPAVFELTKHDKKKAKDETMEHFKMLQQLWN